MFATQGSCCCLATDVVIMCLAYLVCIVVLALAMGRGIEYLYF
jgi:hypothetical protein